VIAHFEANNKSWSPKPSPNAQSQDWHTLVHLLNNTDDDVAADGPRHHNSNPHTNPFIRERFFPMPFEPALRHRATMTPNTKAGTSTSTVDHPCTTTK
jgi:hypothetical protein